MAVFKPGVPIETRESVVRVDPGLAPGRYLFTLVVTDVTGNRSEPSQVVVTVPQRTGPITGPVIGPVIGPR